MECSVQASKVESAWSAVVVVVDGTSCGCVFGSPDGRLLASISGSPDYMLTVWNWRQELIMLRCKAFSQDVTRVSFSHDMIGVLTTAGTGHIRYSAVFSHRAGVN